MEFFEWFRAQDPERFFSKELAAKDAWDYQQGRIKELDDKLKIANDAIDMAINESDVFTYYEIVEKLIGIKQRLAR